MNAKANRNKSATATSTQKTPVEHPFFLSGCREGEGDSGGISSLIVFYAQHLSAGEQPRLAAAGCGVLTIRITVVRINRARWRVERSSLLSQSNLDKLLSDVYWLFLTNAQKKLRPTQWNNSFNICTNTRDSEFSNDPVLEILRLLDPAELATRT